MKYRQHHVVIRIVSFAVIVLTFAIIIAGFLSGCTPMGRASWNTYWGAVQKADDATNYHTKKEVEDTCRSMVASYEADRLTYEQYKDSDDEEKQGWAEQAKMRANKTAATYNNFILENSYVWSGNVPNDIRRELLYLE